MEVCVFIGEGGHQRSTLSLGLGSQRQGLTQFISFFLKTDLMKCSQPNHIKFNLGLQLDHGPDFGDISF